MIRRRIVVVPTGTANLASMLAALERVGASPEIASDGTQVRDAEHVVVPGVGAFGAARECLVAAGLWQPLADRLSSGRATLLVCLGMQLLADRSEESPGLTGFGIVPGNVVRFPAPLRVPQLGWNMVTADAECQYLESGFAYFANSYFLPELPPPLRGAHSRHGVRFVSAVECGGMVACQFHPELSGAYGLALLGRWVRGEARAPGEGPRARIIPCLDVRDGRVVKGVRFQALRDVGSPAALAARYEAEGADEVVILDISATNEGRKTQIETVRAVRARLGIPLTVGGGVQELDDVKRLLDAGADKVAINTAAVKSPPLIDAMSARFGRQCIVVAIDAIRTGAEAWEVVIRSGKERTGLSVTAWAKEVAERGAGEILLTSFDQDGTREGYDLNLLQAVSSVVSIPVVASGGAATVDHLLAALDSGADAVLAASIFHDQDMTVAEVRSAMAMAGARVRA